MTVTDDPAAVVVTYALGSCIGVTVYDPVAKIGGLLHFMLPAADLSKDKAAANPAMFGDTGIPILFKSCYEKGAKKERLIVCAAGGAEVIADNGHFQIGSRNRTLLRKIFWKNGILLAGDDTGGANSRTLSLRMTDGAVMVRTQGAEKALWTP
ncbi:MAG: chemotaxis protein CheD [Planctomycetes bacterium]|nr:chemotaxis protein CheD [Planctomycetota bacterium]